MNPRERRTQLLREAKALAQKAEVEEREFTTEEKTRIRALLDEAAKIKELLDKAPESKSLMKSLTEFLDEGNAASHRGTAGRSNPTDGPWTTAMSKAFGLEHGKGLTLPPSGAFNVAPPEPIVAQNIPFGHLLDVINVDTTLQTSGVSYLRSTSRTRASRVAPHGSLKPTKNLTLERVNARAETIAVLLEGIRKQDIDDYKNLVKFIDFELKGDVLSTLDQQMLLGTGPTADPDDDEGELEGIFFQDGILVQEFATTASASLRRGMARVEQGGYENTAVALNPIDYAELELELNTAGDYRGNIAPAEPGPRRVWGVPVVSVPSAPLGLAVTGDFSSIQLWIREQIQVSFTDAAGDDFKRNQYTVRAEMRAAFGVGIPQSLAVVALNGTVDFPAAP